MTNNFEKMMETMLEQMMAKQMEKMMAKMFGLEEETVAKAETTDSIKDAYKPKREELKREDFLNSLTEEEQKPAPKDYSDLDFVVVNNTMCKLNQRIPTNIWQLNDMLIKTHWNGKCMKYRGEYVWKFETKNQMILFLQSYQIKTEPTEEDKINLANYNKAKAQQKAEYYANKAK